MSAQSIVGAASKLDSSEELRHHISVVHQLAAPLASCGKLVLASYGQNPVTGNNLPPKVCHFPIGDVDGMTTKAIELTGEQHRNVYASCAVFRSDLAEGKKGSEADIVGVLGLIADFDDAGASQWATRLPIPPNFVLETSIGRFQCFYFFDRPLPPGEIKPLAIALKQHAACDHGTADVSHVWRLPGTSNYPNKKKVDAGRSPDPQIVKVVAAWDGVPTKADDLAAALSAPHVSGDEFSADTPSSNHVGTEIPNWLDDLIELSVPEGSRSGHNYKIIRELVKLGWTDNRITDKLITCPSGSKYNGDRGRALLDVHRCRQKGDGDIRIPIKGEQPWPEPLGEEAFYGLPGEIVRAIEPQTEADPAALLIQVLVAAGNCLGRCGYYLVEGDRHYSNIFAVVVGKTSKARKGTSWGRIRQMFEALDDAWVHERVVGGLSSGEGVIWAVRDPISKMEKDKKSGELREIVVDEGVWDKRLLVQESEFAGALRVMKREGSILSRLLRDAWDRGDVASLTKNSQARATGAHISIVGHSTAEELKKYLDDTEVANGFANRFLFICAARSQSLPLGGQRTIQMIEATNKLKKLIEGHQRNERELKWSPDARELWCEIYPELSDARPGMFGVITARAEAQVVRLALIYALLADANEITLAHLHAALAVWRYSEASARHIFGATVGDPVSDTILGALQAAGEKGLTRSEISGLFGNHKGGDIGRALNLLLQQRRVRSGQRPTGGRPVETWWAL